jgi:hypothetical protein
MGTFGPGLYSSDIALDLRAAVGAVLRLPQDDEQLVEILCSAFPEAANNPADEDHTVFWLVLADQFAKQGVASATVRDKAVAIIDGGSDLTCLQRLGMKAADLRKRETALAGLRDRLAAASPTSRPRAVLRQPQPYLFEIGGLYTYPTRSGDPINPFLGNRKFDRASWQPDGFGLLLIVRRGRAFDYLAWYTPLVAIAAAVEKPNLETLSPATIWSLQLPKTCSPDHFRKLEIEMIGTVHLDPERLRQRFPAKPGRASYDWDGRGATIHDQSISDDMDTAPKRLLWDHVAKGEKSITDLPDLCLMRGLSEVLVASE